MYYLGLDAQCIDWMGCSPIIYILYYTWYEIERAMRISRGVLAYVDRLYY